MIQRRNTPAGSLRWISINLALLLFLVTPAVALEGVTVQVLSVGLPEGLPGYDLLGNGEIKIHDEAKRRMTECIQHQLHVRFKWSAYPTKRAIEMLKDGKLDLLYPMGFSADRHATMAHSQATWDNSDILVSTHPIDVSDPQLHLAARLGSPQQVDESASRPGRMSASYRYADLVKLLNTGMVDAVVIPRSIYEEMKNQWPAHAIVSKGRDRRTGFYVSPALAGNWLRTLDAGISTCENGHGP